MLNQRCFRQIDSWAVCIRAYTRGPSCTCLYPSVVSSSDSLMSASHQADVMLAPGSVGNFWQFIFQTQVKKIVGQKFQKLFPINFLAISGNFKQLWVFFHFWPHYFLTQQFKSAQFSVSSRQLNHLKQSMRSSSPVQALDQWEAAIYCTKILSTNKLSYQNPEGGRGAGVWFGMGTKTRVLWPNRPTGNDCHLLWSVRCFRGRG